MMIAKGLTDLGLKFFYEHDIYRLQSRNGFREGELYGQKRSPKESQTFEEGAGYFGLRESDLMKRLYSSCSISPPLTGSKLHL